MRKLLSAIMCGLFANIAFSLECPNIPKNARLDSIIHDDDKNEWSIWVRFPGVGYKGTALQKMFLNKPYNPPTIPGVFWGFKGATLEDIKAGSGPAYAYTIRKSIDDNGGGIIECGYALNEIEAEPFKQLYEKYINPNGFFSNSSYRYGAYAISIQTNNTKGYICDEPTEEKIRRGEEKPANLCATHKFILPTSRLNGG
ncbi:MAG TPA: hypothetical protein VKR58_08525 [Aquella sp.]|nr:hypothetical protein [Aquella sp.]